MKVNKSKIDKIIQRVSEIFRHYETMEFALKDWLKNRSDGKASQTEAVAATTRFLLEAPHDIGYLVSELEKGSIYTKDRDQIEAIVAEDINSLQSKIKSFNNAFEGKVQAMHTLKLPEGGFILFVAYKKTIATNGAKSKKCPVCNGKGFVLIANGITKKNNEIDCITCNRTGMVYES